ncbi:hypothetical protein HYPSUDRAFT_202152 [Hypholoma sublateritium FD-334 SS-4]|uniref:Secreted protein n=1 Tax=Hypholoma sublateritium (strain FD-334 SS-4) TaxID=945553 RepID=A0A0D2MFH5_HYPSF|nr:hypothetical protein HYPSUDRAFT_202152 [Hypholoma sublateritium FD-334 SS-4]
MPARRALPRPLLLLVHASMRTCIEFYGPYSETSRRRVDYANHGIMRTKPSRMDNPVILYTSHGDKSIRCSHQARISAPSLPYLSAMILGDAPPALHALAVFRGEFCAR